MECLINIFKKAYSICVWFKCLWLLFNYSLGDKALDGYSKKKYVCKLLFIFLLGHDIDFGHMEAVNLLSSNKYTEKQIVSNVSYLHSKIIVTLFTCWVSMGDSIFQPGMLRLLNVTLGLEPQNFPIQIVYMLLLINLCF